MEGEVGLKCPHCGFTVLDDAKFCSNCGSPLEQTTTKGEADTNLHCKNCGVELSDGAMFCTSCGTSIQGLIPTRLEVADWGKRFIAYVYWHFYAPFSHSHFLVAKFTFSHNVRLPSIYKSRLALLSSVCMGHAREMSRRQG